MYVAINNVVLLSLLEKPLEVSPISYNTKSNNAQPMSRLGIEHISGLEACRTVSRLAPPLCHPSSLVNALGEVVVGMTALSVAPTEG